MNKKLRFDSIQLHAGYEPKTADKGSMVPPIHMTTAYHFENSQHAADLFALKADGHIYSRISNPTEDVLEKRMAALEGGVGAIAVASGHSAVFLTITTIAEAGDEIVSAPSIYGGLINMFSKTLPKMGIKTHFAKDNDPESFDRLTNENTKAYFVEVLGNPNCNVADLEAISAIAKKNNVPLIVDSTLASPAICRPIEWGANIVIHSATKYLAGHGTVMAGIIVDCGNFDWGCGRFPSFTEPDPSYHGIRFWQDCKGAAFITKTRVLSLRDIGPAISPFNAFMVLQGISTLSIRMERISKSAIEIAKWLEKHPKVSFVNHPGLESSKDYALSQKYLPNGQGGVFTFGLKGGREVGAKFIDSLELFSHVANLGDARSLVVHPASTTHSQLSDQELERAGISQETVRLSIGLEDVRDLIEDLEQAIERATSD